MKNMNEQQRQKGQAHPTATDANMSTFAQQLSQIHHIQTKSLQQKQQEVDQLQQMLQSMQQQLEIKDNEIRRLHERRSQASFVDTDNYNIDQESNNIHAHGDKSNIFSNGGGVNPYQDQHEGGGSSHNHIVSWFSNLVSTSTGASSMIRRRRTLTTIRRHSGGGNSSPINGTSSSSNNLGGIRTIDLINFAIILIVIFHFLHYLSLLTNATSYTTILKQQQEQFVHYQSQQQLQYQKQLRAAIPSTTYDPINDDDSIREYYQPQQQQQSQSQPQPIKPWESTPPTPIKLFDTKNPAIYQRHQCIQAIRQRHNDLLLPLFRSSYNQDDRDLEPVLLVDPAYHANVGDHMLTLGELEFLEGPLRQGTKEDYKKDLPPPIQCHYIQAGGFFPSCTGVVSSSSNPNNPNANKYAMWHAGGNWGDLWRDAQDVRIPSFRTLLQYNYTVIGMPQSLYYSNKDLEQQDAQTIKEKIVLGLGLSKEEEMPLSPGEETDPTQGGRGGDDADPYDFEDMWEQSPPVFINATLLDNPKGRKMAHSKMIFTWREKESFEVAQKLYPFVKNMVVPDIAFQLGPFKPIRREHNSQDKLVDILFLLRADHESQVNQQRNNEYIEKVLSELQGSRKSHKNEKITFRVADWPDRLDIFNTRDPFFTTTAIELLSLGKIVVCDRLHAAILSYLVGLPFVYIDQVSGKITKTFNVAFNTTTITRDDTITPADDKVVGSSGNSNKGTEFTSNRVDCMDGSKAMWAKEQSLEAALAKAVEFIDRFNLNHDEDGMSDGSVLSGLRGLFS